MGSGRAVRTVRSQSISKRWAISKDLFPKRAVSELCRFNIQVDRLWARERTDAVPSMVAYVPLLPVLVVRCARLSRPVWKPDPTAPSALILRLVADCRSQPICITSPGLREGMTSNIAGT